MTNDDHVPDALLGAVRRHGRWLCRWFGTVPHPVWFEVGVAIRVSSIRRGRRGQLGKIAAASATHKESFAGCRSRQDTPGRGNPCEHL
jgi:hypothetical protein